MWWWRGCVGLNATNLKRTNFFFLISKYSLWISKDNWSETCIAIDNKNSFTSLKNCWLLSWCKRHRVKLANSWQDKDPRITMTWLVWLLENNLKIKIKKICMYLIKLFNKTLMIWWLKKTSLVPFLRSLRGFLQVLWFPSTIKDIYVLVLILLSVPVSKALMFGNMGLIKYRGSISLQRSIKYFERALMSKVTVVLLNSSNVSHGGVIVWASEENTDMMYLKGKRGVHVCVLERKPRSKKINNIMKC